MRWLKKWCCSPIHFKFTDKISKFGSSWYHAVENYGNEIHYGKVMVNNSYLDELPQTGLLLSQQFGLGRPTIGFLAKPISSDNVFELQYDMGNLRHFPSTSYRRFGQFVREEHSLSRDWLVQLWLAQKREKDARRRRKQRIVHHVARRDPMSETLSSFQLAFRRFFLSQPAANEHKSQVKKTINQPPVNQYGGGSLSPSSSEEVKLAPLLSRSNLVITRDIEWANLMFAFEQENRYAIVDACYPQSPVGFISEKSNIIFRQLLRTRRPFIAYITDAMGNEIFRVRRPFWLINSTIYAEIDGKEIGVVHRRWHLWRRIYDLYLGKKQFAVVENPGFWNWTFTLKDNDENVLAEVNRDWRGVGFELFTDAGQYVIRFGDADSSFKSPAIEELEVSRPLTLSERAVAVALAVSLDNDYFSRRGGWGFPIMIAGE